MAKPSMALAELVEKGAGDDIVRELEASQLLSAGYTVRRLLGTHPLEDMSADVPSDIFDASAFEDRARRGSRRRNGAA